MSNRTCMLPGILLAGSVSLIGCQAIPDETTVTRNNKNADNIEALYDGEAEVLYDAKEQAETSEEAMEFGEQALQVGAIDRALYQFVTAYQLDPDQYLALHKVGTIQAQRGKLDRAALALSLALRIKPDHAESLLELGLVELRMRRHERAREHLERVIESDLEAWRAFNGLAVLADLNRDFDTAEQHYEKSLQLNPVSPVLWNNRGYSRYLAGDWQSAQNYIRRALDIDPGYEKAWRNLGLIYVRRGVYDEALEAFERVMEKPNAYEHMGTLTMMEGKYDVAEHFLDRAIDTSPTYYEAAYDKADKLEKLRGHGADQGLARALEVDTDPVIHESGLTEAQQKTEENSSSRSADDDWRMPVEHTTPE